MFAGVGVGIAFAGAIVLVIHDADIAWVVLGASATAVVALAWRPLTIGHDAHVKASAPARFGQQHRL